MDKISIPLGILVAIVSILGYMYTQGVGFSVAVEFFSGTFLFTLVGVLVMFSYLVSTVVSWADDSDIDNALEKL